MLYLVAGLCAIALGWWTFRRSSPARATAPAPARKAVNAGGTAALRVAPADQPAPADLPELEVPSELANFHWNVVGDLDPPRHEALLQAIKGIPRPPHSLQKILSPEFVARASSSELSEMVMAEPLIAARVLSSVNAPFYGLHKPVTGIGHAVTFLGMSTVRNICVQYMLAEAFKPRLAVSQRTFDGIWRASAIASELCARLGKALNLPDQSTLSTQVVLSFVGHLSAASLMPPDALKDWLALDRLTRAKREQGVMDLSAGEVGGQLMQSWGLPQAMVDGVREIDRVLVTPVSDATSPDAARNALSYFCARLGERLALGQLTSIEGYSPFQETGPDTFYLNQHLRSPLLRQLPAVLASADMQEAMQHMLSGEAQVKG